MGAPRDVRGLPCSSGQNGSSQIAACRLFVWGPPHSKGPQEWGGIPPVTQQLVPLAVTRSRLNCSLVSRLLFWHLNSTKTKISPKSAHIIRQMHVNNSHKQRRPAKQQITTISSFRPQFSQSSFLKQHIHYQSFIIFDNGRSDMVFYVMDHNQSARVRPRAGQTGQSMCDRCWK